DGYARWCSFAWRHAMTRLVISVPALALLLSLAAAAPVPKGAEKAPLYFPTKVGAKWVYDDDGHKYTMVVTDVEARDGRMVVTTGLVGSDGRTTHFESVAVSGRGLLLLESSGRKYDR